MMKILNELIILLKLKNTFLKNLIALGLVQATNFIIPLISFPYLVRVVGLEKLGIIAYGLTILTYFSSFVDYGFNLSATRQITLSRHNTVEMSKIFSTVMGAKIFLFIISTLCMIIMCNIIPRFQYERFTYLFGLLYVLGSLLMPVWFFQGVENMKYITFANLIAKIVQLTVLFGFVRSSWDYKYVLGIYGLANIVSGLYSIHKAFKIYGLELYKINIGHIYQQLKESWYFFSSTLSIMIITSTTVLILGFYVSNIEIGYYSIAEKIMFVIWTVLNLFSQALYPTVCRLAQESYEELSTFIKKVFVPFAVLILTICLFIYLYADEVVNIIVGHNEPKTVNLVSILVIVPIIVCLNIPAYQMLLAYNHKKTYARIFNNVAILNLVMCFLLTYYLGTLGAAVNMVFIQVILTTSLVAAFYYRRKNLTLVN